MVADLLDGRAQAGFRGEDVVDQITGTWRRRRRVGNLVTKVLLCLRPQTTILNDCCCWLLFLLLLSLTFGEVGAVFEVELPESCRPAPPQLLEPPVTLGGHLRWVRWDSANAHTHRTPVSNRVGKTRCETMTTQALLVPAATATATAAGDRNSLGRVALRRAW